MPLIDVTLTEGRGTEWLRALITGLTDAVEAAIGAPRTSIRVVLREVPTTHGQRGT